MFHSVTILWKTRLLRDGLLAWCWRHTVYLGEEPSEWQVWQSQLVDGICLKSPAVCHVHSGNLQMSTFPRVFCQRLLPCRLEAQGQC